MMSGTHHGHPLACAAGLATMDVVDRGGYELFNLMAQKVKGELNGWAAAKGHPFIMFGDFSVLGYAFTKHAGKTNRTHSDYLRKIDDEKMMIYVLEMASRGYFPVSSW
ncbi:MULTISPECIES: hypothetical protein [unclassified Mesorhizobium]|uniref:hypothetical protein n=1 Tax=unclassified Mesorhizobium TaxID=325217 RepID=UPI002414E485|nr:MULTISPECIES: hypothetical protein [unclassified Mesorhizobium]MDG4889925.1 hypothetical protein [Mesorhizobium sp. WSM4887]MDG4904068.1 hypothetical protein [Mesorhizobium sp. WSM4962]MDG4909095.1 hypothetical protein [Mesorhizobium sp. WSM4898]MDG4921719.1 hypothetical protein [Mesorhizobium sp. WSM4989]